MQFALRDLVRGRYRATHCSHRRGGCFLLSSCECVAAEEAVQPLDGLGALSLSKRLLHFVGGIVRLVERFESWQFGLDEAREHFDRRRDGEFLPGLLAHGDCIERGTMFQETDIFPLAHERRQLFFASQRHVQHPSRVQLRDEHEAQRTRAALRQRESEARVRGIAARGIFAP